MSTWGQMSLSEGHSWTSVNAFFFHDHIMLTVIMIAVMVGGSMTSYFLNKTPHNHYLANHVVEVFWTMYPTYILLLIINPSLMLLYMMDFYNYTYMTIKTIGHQWYWSYEYTDWGKTIQFDSYMISTSDLMLNEFRLLDVDNRMIMPLAKMILIMITSSDVIHAWTLPAAGIKMDAVPGRINSVSTSMDTPGVYFGQCSEICGANHSFMPIVVEVIPFNNFLIWINKNME